MKNKELIAHLVGKNAPDVEVELDVDIYPDLASDKGARQTRRIVEVEYDSKRNVIKIIGDGSLTPDEEKMLAEGLYNREYNTYQRHWNFCDPAIRREILKRCGIRTFGQVFGHSEQAWDELPLLIQQTIMVRSQLEAMALKGN